MTKYISLFGATTTDTQVQVVKENQVIIGIGAGASRKRYVVYKVEHTARGYVYHMVDTETKEISQTDILRPLSQTFGIGRYYDDVNPEFMDAFEAALLVRQAEEQATAQAIAAAKEKAEHDRIAEIGAQRLRRIMPEGVQGVIIAELNETEYTDPSYHPKRAYRHSRLFGHLPQRLRGVEKGGGQFPANGAPLRIRPQERTPLSRFHARQKSEIRVECLQTDPLHP